MLRRCLADRRFLLMLPRAICLQLLHPGIAAGIFQHSLYRERIWQHERRTMPAVIEIAGSARDMRPFIRFAHEHVKGVDDTGRSYHSLNPELFHFQHATLVDTVFAVAERLGPLDPDAHEQLYQQCCRWYRRYGISTRPMPQHWPDFRDYFEQLCATELSAGEHFERFRAEIFAPSDWWQRLAPKAAIRAMQHPRARALTGITVNSADERTLRLMFKTAAILPAGKYPWAPDHESADQTRTAP
ncbi:MAG TPA: oxygenase MpaB family protein [Mycolicibacterium fallax]|nr:oxygenase MpaB family protein [Mycolicibacterium fallax]